MAEYLALDIGGTSIKYGIIDSDGRIIEKHEIPSDAKQGGAYLLEKLFGIIEDCQRGRSIAGIGISTAGIVNGATGEILFASNIPGYAGISLKQEIEERFGISCEVENDVNCAGMAEAAAGAAQGKPVALVMTIGTGIGGCLIINNAVYSGYSYSACEVGFTYVDGDILENNASTRSLIERVAKAKGEETDQWNGRRILYGAMTNDPICIRELEYMVDVLGKGIASLCHVLNPAVVVLGGGIMSRTDYFEPRINAKLDKYMLPSVRENTSLAFAGFRNDAGIMGAYYNFKGKHL